jgi:serine O-acetyltransferase
VRAGGSEGFLGDGCLSHRAVALDFSFECAPRSISLPYRSGYKLVQILSGIELRCEVTVGKPFVKDHFCGIVIGGYTRLGDCCRIRNEIIVGSRRLDVSRALPKLATISSLVLGAKLLGYIRMGNDFVTGANAFVLCDRTDNHMPIGGPAEVKPRKRWEQC